MALIASTGLFVLSILGAALSGILAREIESWSPSISRRLIKIAVGRLPEKLRKRFSEEWHSYVNEVPGVTGKVIEAASFLLAARRMAMIDRRSNELERWGQKVAELEDFRSTLSVVVKAIDSLGGILDSEGIAFPNTLKSEVLHLNQLLREFQEQNDKLAELVSADPPTTFVGKVLNLRKRKRVLKVIGVGLTLAVQPREQADEIGKKLKVLRRHTRRH
jgi:hypothetical protein